jgi:hypothetical protein
VEGTPPHGHGVVGSLLDELDQLRARVEELDRQRHLPDPDTGRATDAQVLINFAALAQFARPEHLPPFERLLIKNRSPQPAMSPGPWELPPTPPRGTITVPVQMRPPRTPPRGVPMGVRMPPRTPPNGFRRTPHDHE